MTTPEHALVGIHTAMAFGVHRWLGWKAVALAAVASIAPDWDGLLILIDISLFDQGHRVWGHSVFSIAATSCLLAYSEARWQWLSKVGLWIAEHIKFSESRESLKLSNELIIRPRLTSLTLVALIAQLIHLPCDMVVSGSIGLSDWPVQPWWPFSNRGYVYPLIPWGDIGPTVIMMAGVLLAAKQRKYVSMISLGTLLLLTIYLFIRGWMRGTI